MTITPDSVVVQVHPNDISEQKFTDVLRAGNSPALGDAHAAYSVLSEYRVSIAFLLAIFHHESQYGKVGICKDYNTKSPGNTRSTRTGVGRVLQIPGRGPFVQYPSWPEGWRDLAFRLIDPTYAYSQEGRTTIRKVIERFAPASDNNSPTSYVNAVVRDMNTWLEQEPPVAGDDSRFRWMPDVSEYGYPQGQAGRSGQPIDLFIVHITAGTDSSGWLRGSNGSSTHYLTDRAFRPREQHVREADAAWTAGNRLYNLRGINMEYETPAGVPISDAQLRNAADTARPILQRNNIPFIYLGRDNGPGKRGIIGHSDVPDPDGSGWGGAGNHTDPGPFWNWQRFISYLNEGSVPPPEDVIVVNGIPIRLGFKAEYMARGASKYAADPLAGAAAIYGFPLAPEYETAFGSAQRFERVTMLWYRDNGQPFDVVMQHRGEEPPPPKAA